MIVEQALRHMENALAREADPFERRAEARLVRLVRPDLLCGHDPVERDAEAPVGCGEQVVVAVRDHAKPEPLLEPRQRRR